MGYDDKGGFFSCCEKIHIACLYADGNMVQ